MLHALCDDPERHVQHVLSVLGTVWGTPGDVELAKEVIAFLDERDYNLFDYSLTHHVLGDKLIQLYRARNELWTSEMSRRRDMNACTLIVERDSIARARTDLLLSAGLANVPSPMVQRTLSSARFAWIGACVLQGQ